MEREIYNRAEELVEEIERIDLLIKYINNSETCGMDSRVNDFAFLVKVIGEEEVVTRLEARKKMLEDVFKEL